jgi:FAD synthetase
MKRVLAGGAFNIIHPGHVYFLGEAKRLGDYLIVVVANDETVRRNKKLVFRAGDRKGMVESLKFVDKAVIGNGNDFSLVLEKERPDIIALGYDQSLDPELEKRAKKMGIKIKRMGKLPGYSTSNIAGK